MTGDPGISGSPDAINAGYKTPYPAASVPEPETYGMMIAGLGLMGMVHRKKSA